MLIEKSKLIIDGNYFYNQQYDMPHTVIYYSENKEFKVIKKEFQSKQPEKYSMQQKFDNSNNLSDILFLGKQLIQQLSQRPTYYKNLIKINKIIAKMNQKEKMQLEKLWPKR